MEVVKRWKRFWPCLPSLLNGGFGIKRETVVALPQAVAVVSPYCTKNTVNKKRCCRGSGYCADPVRCFFGPYSSSVCASSVSVLLVGCVVAPP